MKKKIYIVLFGLLICLAKLSFAMSDPLDADCLISDIKIKGAKAVMAKLRTNEMMQFEKVCDNIETGQVKWLEVARRLMPGSDAATTESLIISVSRALPKAPRQVLELIEATEHDRTWAFTTKNTCVSTFIEPEPGVSERYLLDSAKALTTLNTGKNAKLEQLRKDCLKNIQNDIRDAKKRGLWKPE